MPEVLKKDGIIALECLQRAFEIALNYSVHFKKSNPSILKLRYDTELLVTGKKSKKTLAERYNAQKEIEKEKKKSSKKSLKKPKKSSNKIISDKQKSLSLFWIFVELSGIISTILILTIYLLSFVA